MSWTIYHNPRCQKSRQTLEILQKKKIKTQVVEYLKTSPSRAEIQSLLTMLKIPPSELIRKKESKVKELQLDLTDEKMVLDAMVKYPELIERPIVVHNDQAVIGRPPENVLKLL